MVIDLTQDSESEEQAQPLTFQSLLQLPLRSPTSVNPSISSLKRKSDRDTSEDSSDAPPKRFISNINQSIRTNRASHDFRAARTPSLGASSNSDQNSVSVVIPSPSTKLKKEIQHAEWVKDEPIGVSQNYFPTDAYEKRAIKGAYPISKKVDRSNTLLSIDSSNSVASLKTLDSAVSVKASINAKIIETLRTKLQLIKGPRVSVMPKDELALALAVQNFQFVNSYQLRQGVKRVDESFNAGCTCGVVCDPSRCTCLEQRVDSDEKLIPYIRRPDDPRNFVLSPEFLNMKSKIYECNSRCGCEGRCWNTMVQHGRTVRLEIFHTGNRGFGLRSLDSIRAGQFIDRYLGEIITSAAASKREEIATSEGGHSYLFVLDWDIEDASDSNDSDDPDISAPYVVDGQKYGSPTRFMNHSCNPNCKIVPASRNHGDDRIYDLAFFAVRDIPALTELTFDYNPGWEGSKNKKLDPDALPCLCGEPNCRNQLWPNTRKGTK